MKKTNFDLAAGDQHAGLPADGACRGGGCHPLSDITDNYTATAVESLRLMGVLDGYGDGTFRPNAVLTRAQFCKMAVYAMDGSGELGRYSTVTIFPDVKPSHWASAYINMASQKGIISGFADGIQARTDRDRRTGGDDPHAGAGLQGRGHGRRVAPELLGGGPIRPTAC